MCRHLRRGRFVASQRIRLEVSSRAAGQAGRDRSHAARIFPPHGMPLARLKHLLPLALLFAGLAALWAFGLQQDLSWPGLARHQADLLAIVAARPITTGAAYVAIYIVTVACSLPEGAVVTVAGGLLFGIALGAVLAVIGSSIGAVILFLAARYAFADLVAARAAPLMARIRPGL